MNELRFLDICIHNVNAIKREKLRLSSTETRPQSWMVETNYDHWQPMPRWDNRRATAEFCMKEKSTMMSADSVFDVLSTAPVFNGRTSWTSLMDVADGVLETYVRLDAGE